MVLNQTTDRTRLRRKESRQAIVLAMEGRWREAAKVNKEIVRDFPDDLEAYNRLGKALSELGHYNGARRAFKYALKLSPNNHIARKKLARLDQFGNERLPSYKSPKVIPHLFIADGGKSGLTKLHHVASETRLPRVAPGDMLSLKLSDHSLNVETGYGEYLGQVEHRLGMRLHHLIKNGNRYEAALICVGDTDAVAIIREVYRNPDQVSVNPFSCQDTKDYNPDGKELIGHYLGEGRIEADWDVETNSTTSEVLADQDDEETPFSLGKDHDETIKIDDEE